MLSGYSSHDDKLHVVLRWTVLLEGHNWPIIEAVRLDVRYSDRFDYRADKDGSTWTTQW